MTLEAQVLLYYLSFIVIYLVCPSFVKQIPYYIYHLGGSSCIVLFINYMFYNTTCVCRVSRVGGGVVSTDSYFRIPQARRSDEADYFCKATNEHGSTDMRTILYVRPSKETHIEGWCKLL